LHDVIPIDTRIEEPRDASRVQHHRTIHARGDDTDANVLLTERVHQLGRRLVRFDSARLQLRQEVAVLALSERMHAGRIRLF